MNSIKKYIWVIMIFALVSVNSIAIKRNADAIHQKPSYKYLKSVTVYIEGASYTVIHSPNSTDAEAEHWVGTGVVVKVDKDYTYILTNNHVAGMNKLYVQICIHNLGKKIYCDVIAKHPTQDLALVRVKGQLKGKEVVKGLSYPIITEPVYTVGHALGRPFIYGEGVFSGTIIEHDIYQLPCIGGQSGSGIFSKEGYLLGLVYSVFGGMNYQLDFTRANAVKGIYLKEFLEENLK